MNATTNAESIHSLFQNSGDLLTLLGLAKATAEGKVPNENHDPAETLKLLTSLAYDHASRLFSGLSALESETAAKA